MIDKTKHFKDRFGFMEPGKVQAYEENGKVYIRLIKVNPDTKRVSYCDAELKRTGVADEERWIVPKIEEAK